MLVTDSIYKNISIYQGVDLIGGTADRKNKNRLSSTKGSFFVIVTVGVTKTYQRILLNIVRARGITFRNQVDLIIENGRKFNPKMIWVEANNAQSWAVQELIEITDLPVKGKATGGNKYDLDEGIPALAMEFENGKWLLPYGDESTRKLVDILIEELTTYPIGSTSDILMALWFATLAVKEFEKGMKKVAKTKEVLSKLVEGKRKLNVYEMIQQGKL